MTNSRHFLSSISWSIERFCVWIKICVSTATFLPQTVFIYKCVWKITEWQNHTWLRESNDNFDNIYVMCVYIYITYIFSSCEKWCMNYNLHSVQQAVALLFFCLCHSRLYQSSQNWWICVSFLLEHEGWASGHLLELGLAMYDAINCGRDVRKKSIVDSACRLHHKDVHPVSTSFAISCRGHCNASAFHSWNECKKRGPSFCFDSLSSEPLTTFCC